MPSVLVVCTANICRSPMAEALLRQRLAGRQDGASWQVQSAGTWAADGRSASPNGIAVMRERGHDLSSHRSRQVDGPMLEGADLVLTMTSGHAEALRADFPEQAHKICRLAEMMGLPYDVADPYGGTLDDYRRTADELEHLVDRGLARIVELTLAAGLRGLES